MAFLMPIGDCCPHLGPACPFNEATLMSTGNMVFFALLGFTLGVVGMLYQQHEISKLEKSK